MTETAEALRGLRRLRFIGAGAMDLDKGTALIIRFRSSLMLFSWRLGALVERVGQIVESRKREI